MYEQMLVSMYNFLSHLKAEVPKAQALVNGEPERAKMAAKPPIFASLMKICIPKVEDELTAHTKVYL